MALMLGALHRALISAGANEDEAIKAAEEVAAHNSENRLTKIEADITGIKAELQFHRWTFGIVIALQVAILARVLFL